MPLTSGYASYLAKKRREKVKLAKAKLNKERKDKLESYRDKDGIIRIPAAKKR